ncbi:type-F conjugative transfer system secretin TraK [Methyloglobulus sp.]|uniref:TraK domain-containing protein n=1 Tax=Methyloglobulus sp. TaxID=2518622 RepID=UPI0032B800E7
MRSTIMLILLMAWVTAAFGTDVPLGLPFPPVDNEEVPVHPQQIVPGGVIDDSKNQQDSQGQRPMSGVLHTQQDLPQETTQPNEQTPEEQQYGKSARKSSQKRRPKVLDSMPISRFSYQKKGGDGLDRDKGAGLVIRPRPGQTENVVIARGKLNRIVTPYADPKVLTVDSVETKVDGSSVYIATDSETPVSLFITDAETGGAASLQLSPQSMVSPVEMRIEADQGKLVERGDGELSYGSRLFRQDSPYITEVKGIMQALGKQLIPSGFTLVETNEDSIPVSVCHAPNLSFRLGQVLAGTESRIFVFIAQNNGTNPMVFEESVCASENTVAVAAWPKVHLAPGERTEVYVLMRQPELKSGEETRPALL